MSKTNDMISGAYRLAGVSYLFAVHRAMQDHDVNTSERYAGWTYDMLAPAQIETMQHFEERVEDALAHHIVLGSALWWIYLPVITLARLLVRHRDVEIPASPERLAQEYNQASTSTILRDRTLMNAPTA